MNQRSVRRTRGNVCRARAALLSPPRQMPPGFRHVAADMPLPPDYVATASGKMPRRSVYGVTRVLPPSRRRRTPRVNIYAATIDDEQPLTPRVVIDAASPPVAAARQRDSRVGCCRPDSERCRRSQPLLSAPRHSSATSELQAGRFHFDTPPPRCFAGQGTPRFCVIRREPGSEWEVTLVAEHLTGRSTRTAPRSAKS